MVQKKKKASKRKAPAKKGVAKKMVAKKPTPPEVAEAGKVVRKTLRGKALELLRARWENYLMNRGVLIGEADRLMPDAVARISGVYEEEVGKLANMKGVEKAEEKAVYKMDEMYQTIRDLLKMERELEDSNPRTKGRNDMDVVGVKRLKTASAGLGDTLEEIARRMKIKKAVEWFNKKTGKDCGCEKRKDYLNARFKYRVMDGLCMNRTEYEFWHEFRKSHDPVIPEDEAVMLSSIHARLFNHEDKPPCSNCPKVWQRYISEINTVYKSYLILDREG